MSAITTHVLDTARGTPAAGVLVRLERVSDAGPEEIGRASTDPDGRVRAIGPQRLRPGTYRLIFGTAEYFARLDRQEPRTAFFPEVAVTFTADGEAPHYHVPLLLSPFGYATYRGAKAMAITLGPNQYGKAETRVVRVYRDGGQHEIRDLNVSTLLRGDFAEAHTRGDQASVLPTDSQKNTCFAFAKQKGVGEIEDYALDLARHFVNDIGPVTGARVEVEEYRWERASVAGQPHPHTFVRACEDVRTTAVTVSQQRTAQWTWVVSGLKDLVLLKSTGSEFAGFLKDPYTTLAETRDRILATSLTARWRHDLFPRRLSQARPRPKSWDEAHAQIRQILIDRFADVHSLALQQTLWEMGRAVLEARDDVAEIRLSAPNRHHFLADLAPFGLDNPGEVFHAADRPYGLIQCAVRRDDADDPGLAWDSAAAFT